MPALTRGPLSPRVYWARRALVLATALVLVVAIARLLNGGSDASSGADQATQVAAVQSPTTSTSVTELPTPTATKSDGGENGDKPGGKSGGKHASAEPDPTPTLAAPVGECDGTDVAVTPKLTQAVAGGDVMIVLQLRTLESEACTWRSGHDALAVTITSGNDTIWTSRQCPRAIPVRDVVVRQDVTANLGVTWNARRSDDTCSRLTAWAMPGWYHVSAASLGGEPSDVQFELETPTAATITKTASPKQSPSQHPSQRPSGRPATR